MIAAGFREGKWRSGKMASALGGNKLCASGHRIESVFFYFPLKYFAESRPIAL